MKRIYYIDWLRIIAIAGVFVFHNAHFFDPIYWHVKNPQQNEQVLLFLGFMNLWIMPLFFFLSGGSALFGLKKPFHRYLKGKTLRLLVPFIIGVLFLIPPQKYVEGLSNGAYTGSFPAFLSVYFGGEIFNHGFGFNPVWIGIISYHLWFLGHLFLISLLSFGILKYLNNNGEQIFRFFNRITSIRGSVLLMFLPVALVRILLRKQFPEYTGWCDFAVYFLYFLYGFMFTHNEGLKLNLLRSRYPALITGIVLYVVYILSFRFEGSLLKNLFHNNSVTAWYMFQETAGALATWSWLVFITAEGIRYLNSDHSLREPLNEAVLPFYILHQTVVLLIGFQVVQWNWPAWYKFGFIAGVSLFIIITIYMLAIRPFNTMRFAFGMNKMKINYFNQGGKNHESK